ncbi:unnamed protein product [Calypogeia fissa]
MAFKRKLTANGPAAANDLLMSSQRKLTQSSGIPNTTSFQREEISASQGNEWSMHGPGIKRPSIYKSQIQEVEENADAESTRQSPYMRFQTQRGPVHRSRNEVRTNNQPEGSGGTRRRNFVSMVDQEPLGDQRHTTQPQHSGVQRRNVVNLDDGGPIGNQRHSSTHPQGVQRRSFVNLVMKDLLAMMKELLPLLIGCSMRP